MPNIKLTKRFIDAVPAPIEKSQEIYLDTETKHLGLRITRGGVKSFVFDGTVQGKQIRRVIGQYGGLTLEEARKCIIDLLQKIQHGNDPFAPQTAPRELITLNKVYQDYLATRKLAPLTTKEYAKLIRLYVSDWEHKDMNTLSRAAVQQRYAAIKERSPSQANKVMRVLRALFNFAQYQYEFEGNPVIKNNPVDILSHTRAWVTIPRKQSHIPANKLKAWYNAIHALKTSYVRYSREMLADYMLLILFHGLRANEAANITRAAVSFEDRTLTLCGDTTKSGRAAVLPLSDFSEAILRRRVSATHPSQQYLFPSALGDAPLVNASKAVKWVATHASIPHSLHDLRRTYVTVAESLDISPYAIKSLVNHHLPSDDVTAGYIVMSPERLRAANQQIADYLQRAMGILTEDTQIIPFKNAR